MSDSSEITIRFTQVDGQWKPSDYADLDANAVMLAVYKLMQARLSEMPGNAIPSEVTQQLNALREQMNAFPGINAYMVTSIVDEPDEKSVTVARRSGTSEVTP